MHGLFSFIHAEVETLKSLILSFWTLIDKVRGVPLPSWGQYWNYTFLLFIIYILYPDVAKGLRFKTNCLKFIFDVHFYVCFSLHFCTFTLHHYKLFFSAHF